MIPFAALDNGSELSVLENVIGKQVPQGTPLTLGVGEIVTVTQALGDTVTLDIGSRLVRIETKILRSSEFRRQRILFQIFQRPSRVKSGKS